MARKTEAPETPAPPAPVGPPCPMCDMPTSTYHVPGLWACYLDELTVNQWTGKARAMRRVIPAVRFPGTDTGGRPPAESQTLEAARPDADYTGRYVRMNPLTGEPMPCSLCERMAVEPHGRYCPLHEPGRMPGEGRGG